MLAEVMERLKSVAELGERIMGAAELAALVRDDALPAAMPAAAVLPLGLQGGQSDAVTGMFRQAYGETIGIVIISAAAGDVTGAIALPEIQTLIDAIITKMAGWTPGGTPGVFVLGRGALIGLTAGAVLYQLDFTITQQLRIAS